MSQKHTCEDFLPLVVTLGEAIPTYINIDDDDEVLGFLALPANCCDYRPSLVERFLPAIILHARRLRYARAA